MPTLYHVATEYDGGDLVSLAARLGSESEAIEAWLERWPEGGPEMAAHHVHCVHLYATRAEADAHAESFGGIVYEIDSSLVDDIRVDGLEFDHPVVRRVPRDAIKVAR